MWARRYSSPNRCEMCFSTTKKHSRLTALALLGLALSACAADSADTIPLHFGTHLVQAEVAATPSQRERGLMHRTQLPAHSGMLFVFERADRHCFWMKSTPLPLSIAFINEQGLIVSLADMMPNTTTLHCPPVAIRYALEVSQGEFQQRGIAPGTTVGGLPH